MSWADDFGIDADVLIEITERQEYYNDLTNRDIAFELVGYMKYVKPEYRDMVRSITNRALAEPPLPLSEKQRNVMINTLVNIEEAWN